MGVGAVVLRLGGGKRGGVSEWRSGMGVVGGVRECGRSGGEWVGVGAVVLGGRCGNG